MLALPQYNIRSPDDDRECVTISDFEGDKAKDSFKYYLTRPPHWKRYYP